MPVTPRTAWIVAMGGFAAVAVGSGIAAGHYTWAVLTAALIGIIFVEWRGGARFDAIVLSVLLVGYLVGNRGFAQIAPARGLPLFLGELGLAFGLTMAVIRGALLRKVPVVPDLLNVAVMVWIAAGTLRVWHDVRIHGGNALRDFATIYYAGFFFLAQLAAAHPPSRRWLERSLVMAATILPLITILYQAFPDFFLQQLTFRSVPLIYQKGDLAGTFLFGCALFLFTRDRPGPRRIIVTAGALLGIAVAFHPLSRAALVAFVVMIVVWAWARLRRPLTALAVAGLVAVSVLMGSAMLQRHHLEDTAAYALYENVVSIFDVGGTRMYRNPDTADSGGNNQFRLVWWRTVTLETWDKNPLLGLGFGHDLAERFLTAYGLREDENFAARSPHSIAFTLLGRLGLFGAVVFLFFTAAWSVSFMQVAQQLRHGATEERVAWLPVFGLWTLSGTLFISAWFGVVLEGPMGAVVFWTVLGMANSERRRLREGVSGSEAEPLPPPQARLAPTESLPS